VRTDGTAVRAVWGRVVRLSDGRYHSFVVRVWRGDGGRLPMHGRVTHVASHHSVGFTDLERMLEFIREQLTCQEAGQEAGPPAPPAADGAGDGEASGAADPGEASERGPGGPA
jgi:hypothetical protein